MKKIIYLCLISWVGCATQSTDVPPNPPIQVSPIPVTIERQAEKLNAAMTKEAFYMTKGDCTFAAFLTTSKQSNTLSLISGQKLNIQNGFLNHAQAIISCGSLEEYQISVRDLLKDIVSSYPKLKLTEFVTSYQNPWLQTFQEKLAILSVTDAEAIKTLKTGEKKTTFNKVADRLIKTNQLLSPYIEIHKSIGLILEFKSAEKIFRDRVETSQIKDQLLKAGAKPKDQYISGAAIYHFDMTLKLTP